MAFDATWLVGIVGSGLVGTFFGVVFLQPFLAGIAPRKWRFWSFRAGKRLRWKKVRVRTEVRTLVRVRSERPLSWIEARRMVEKALSGAAIYDDAVRRFVFEDKGGHVVYTIELGHDDEVSQIVVSGRLGELAATDLSSRLLSFHVWLKRFTDLLVRENPTTFEPSELFSVEGETSWEPDLIGFLRDASATTEDTAVDLTVAPSGGKTAITFTGRKIRTSGDLGPPFVEHLQKVLELYT